MATIRQLRTKRWQAVIRRKGLPNQYKTFTIKSEASQWVRNIESQVDKGIFNDYALLEKTQMSGLFARYAIEISPLKKSYAKEVSRLKRITQALGQLNLTQITPTKIALFRDIRLSEGLSGATVVKDLNTLSHVIEIARKEWGYYLPNNPVKLIRKPQVSSHRIRRLSVAEELKLLLAAKSSRSIMMPNIIIFAIEAGMRLGEILGLEWQAIHQSIATLSDTKNGESREVPLSKKAMQAIKHIPKNINNPKIFWRWTTVSGFQSSWQRVVKKSDISNLRFHDLRHEAISRFFEKGLNPMEVSAISGHKSMQVLKRYTHMKPSYLLQKINGI